MNANDVLIDLLEDNRRRLHRVFDVMRDDCVMWKPEADANNIAVTVWHMARIFDAFLTQQAKGDLPEEECWFRYGWAEQTGYDPRGIGQNGWGMLTSYTQEDVAAMPQLTREQVLGYLNKCIRCGQGVSGQHAHRGVTDTRGGVRWEILQISMRPNGIAGQCEASG